MLSFKYPSPDRCLAMQLAGELLCNWHDQAATADRDLLWNSVMNRSAGTKLFRADEAQSGRGWIVRGVPTVTG
jgi:hypothetical protein